jgi:pyruvate dehydrogenase (quinone)
VSRTVADQFAEILAAAGVKRIYGIVGDSLNGLTDAIQRQGKIEWIHVRHEEVAAFAAGAEAHLTGDLAVCAGSCGPGNLHLVNGLFDCHHSRVPMLAIAAHIPSAEIGSGYFQETHPETLFRECSHYCELVSGAPQMPRSLEIAIREAVGRRGVSVIVMPGDVALQRATDAPARRVDALLPSPPVVIPPNPDLDELAELFNGDGFVTILCGSGCQGAHDDLLAVGGRLKAPIVHALRGKEHVEWDNPYDVGMTSPVGFSSGYYAMLDCDVLLILGSDFPYRQFYPQRPDVRIAQVDIRSENLGHRASIDLGVIGDIKATLTALLPLLNEKRDSLHLEQARQHYGKARKQLNDLVVGKAGGRVLHPQQVAKAISDQAAAERDLHLRCGSADGMGGTLSGNEWQAEAHWVFLAWVRRERHGSGGGRAIVLSRATGRLTLGQRRLYHADGRPPQPCPSRSHCEGRSFQRRHSWFHRA